MEQGDISRIVEFLCAEEIDFITGSMIGNSWWIQCFSEASKTMSLCRVEGHGKGNRSC